VRLRTRIKYFAWSVENWLKGYKFGPIQRCRCGHTTPCPFHSEEGTP
jgi:hypothetical protein